MKDCPFELYLHSDGDVPSPKGGIGYLAAENGTFLIVQTPHYDAIVRAEKLPMLEPVQPGASLKVPPIPPVQVAQIVAFFREVWDRYASEAMLVIAHSAATQEYRFFAPHQTVSAGKCNYTMPRLDAAPEGFEFIGTVHSHGCLPAFHSGTDEHDEMFFNGVHATIGFVGAYHPQVVASLAHGKQRFPIDPRQLFGGLQVVAEAGTTPYIFPAGHLEALEEQLLRAHGREALNVLCKVLRAGSLGTIFDRLTPIVRRSSTPKDASDDERIANRFAIELPPDATVAALQPDPAWLAAVVPQSVLSVCARIDHFFKTGGKKGVSRHRKHRRRGGDFDTPFPVPTSDLGDDIATHAAFDAGEHDDGHSEGDTDMAAAVTEYPDGAASGN